MSEEKQLLVESFFDDVGEIVRDVHQGNDHDTLDNFADYIMSNCLVMSVDETYDYLIDDVIHIAQETLPNVSANQVSNAVENELAIIIEEKADEIADEHSAEFRETYFMAEGLFKYASASYIDDVDGFFNNYLFYNYDNLLEGILLSENHTADEPESIVLFFPSIDVEEDDVDTIEREMEKVIELLIEEQGLLKNELSLLVLTSQDAQTDYERMVNKPEDFAESFIEMLS